MIPCRKDIQLTNYSNTCCMLPMGHEGPCEVADETGFKVPKFQLPKCGACKTEGDHRILCALPKGHDGKHASIEFITAWD